MPELGLAWVGYRVARQRGRCANEWMRWPRFDGTDTERAANEGRSQLSQCCRLTDSDATSCNLAPQVNWAYWLTLTHCHSSYMYVGMVGDAATSIPAPYAIYNPPVLTVAVSSQLRFDSQLSRSELNTREIWQFPIKVTRLIHRLSLLRMKQVETI